ncbi:unnamed protein product, partial [Coregonus sp. 'balchen']
MGAHRSEGRRDWLQQDAVEQPPIQTMNPWNIMIKHRQVHRRGRRSQMTMSYTDPVISMDLLRTVLQPSFNEDIMGVFRKYMKFFEKAASNVKENVGDDVQTDQLIREACRNCLENAKHLFSDGEKAAVARTGPEPPVKRVKLEDESSQRASPIPKKRKGRPTAPVGSYDKPVTYSNAPRPKTLESVKREGPKYAADAQDKHWLAERQHMRATDCPDLKMTPIELKPFTVPGWMIEKMQKAME